jgi:hypothetical protein
MSEQNNQNETWGTYKGEIKGFRFENSETKLLGPPIGGSGVQSEIDRDSDGNIGDGTPDERPAPKKGPSKNPPKVRREYFKLPPKPPKPTPRSPYKPGYLLPDEEGNWQGYDGTPPKNKPYFREHRDGSIYEIRPNRPPKKVGVGPNEII